MLCSIEYNKIGDKGASALAAILKETMISNLKCAVAPKCLGFVSAPIDTPPSPGSLASNALCGVGQFGGGTYNAEGITKLCEGLKGSAVTSLECAAAPSVRFPVSAH